MFDRRSRFAVLTMLALASGCGFHSPAAVDATPSALPTVAFGAAGAGADESSGTVTVPVTLSAPADSPVTVSYQVSAAGTAMPGDDFTVGGSMVTFNVGETTQSIDVTILPDSNMTEANETIVLALASPTGAELGSPSEYTITIADHILPRVQFVQLATTAVESVQTMLAVTLDKPAEGVTTVEVKLGGTATRVEDYTIADHTVVTFQNGEQSAMVPIGEVDDALDEDEEQVTFLLENPSANVLVGAVSQASHTMTDNDDEPTVGFTATTSTLAESGGTTTVEVRLNVPSGRQVTVNFDRANTSTAQSPQDATVTGAPGMLVFAKGQVSKTISVAVVDDTLDEDTETVNLVLSGATNAQLTGAAHSLSITDNDNPPNIAFMVATQSVTEASTDVTIAVVLSTASGKTVTAPFAAIGAGSTANDPADYTVTTASPLTFAPGTTMQLVTVNIKQDTLDEPDETATFTLGAVTNATKVAPLAHTLTIVDDNDVAPVVQFDPLQADRAIAEGDAGTTPFTYDVVLDRASGFTVDVAIAFTGDADAGDFTASGLPVSFAPGQTRKTITLNIIGDTQPENGSSDQIIMSIDPGLTTNATVGTVDERTHTILDDD
ncbi:MAG: Calx-beta domain-containing protein [Kofleriaceae bacterium]